MKILRCYQLLRLPPVKKLKIYRPLKEGGGWPVNGDVTKYSAREVAASDPYGQVQKVSSPCASEGRLFDVGSLKFSLVFSGELSTCRRRNWWAFCFS